MVNGNKNKTKTKPLCHHISLYLTICGNLWLFVHNTHLLATCMEQIRQMLTSQVIAADLRVLTRTLKPAAMFAHVNFYSQFLVSVCCSCCTVVTAELHLVYWCASCMEYVGKLCVKICKINGLINEQIKSNTHVIDPSRSAGSSSPPAKRFLSFCHPPTEVVFCLV